MTTKTIEKRKMELEKRKKEKYAVEVVKKGLTGPYIYGNIH